MTDTKPTPILIDPAQDTLWVVTIEHKHGTNASIATSRERAMQAVVDFAADWWDEEVSDGFEGGRERPEDPQQLVEEYFAHVGDESYTIAEADFLT